jgi:hypothetical protein
MSGKSIAVGTLLVGIGGLAVMNWWTYLNEEGLLPRRADAVSTPRAAAAAAASEPPGAANAAAKAATDSTTAWHEPEPPKRLPKSGEGWTDPFQLEAADVVVLPPVGTKVGKTVKPAYVVDLILIDGSRRLASINGTLRGVGERVGSAQVLRIERDGVILRDGKKQEQFVRLAEPRGGKS